MEHDGARPDTLPLVDCGCVCARVRRVGRNDFFKGIRGDGWEGAEQGPYVLVCVCVCVCDSPAGLCVCVCVVVTNIDRANPADRLVTTRQLFAGEIRVKGFPSVETPS